MNLSDRLGHALVRNQVQNLRFAADLRKRVLRMLERAGSELLAELVKADPTTAGGQRRVAALLKQAESIVSTRYLEMADLVHQDLSELAQVSAGKVMAILNDALAGDGLQLIRSGLTKRWADALASDTLIDGAPSAEWWARQGSAMSEAFADEIRTGLARGENLKQLRDRIMGQNIPGVNAVGKVDLRTVSDPLQRAVIKEARRAAEALVRTSVISTANAAHLSLFQDNADIIASMQWVSTLDLRTCPRCMGLDGLKWDLEGRPIGHGHEFPGPTLHFGCRCTQIPITKSWEDLARDAHGNSTLGKSLDQMSEGTRASMDGQVAATLDYEGWLKTQPVADQKEVLGPARWDLWRRGKLTLPELLDQRNNPVTLAQLKAS